MLALCERLKSAKIIAFDTEFVSEDSFVPELCLIQIATEDEIVAIDTIAIKDSAPFWEVLGSGNHITIAHAAREELRFAMRYANKAPTNLFDTQIAGGLVGPDYPASYSSLVARILKNRVDKGETRTDWRKRPLTEGQINYALEDVRHLIPIYEKLTSKLEKTGRASWIGTEMESWMQSVMDAEDRPRWRRVSGIGGLSSRCMVIVKELWFWRQEEARRRDIPPRRVLRDDLIVEIAKRKSSDIEKIKAIRGIYRGIVKQCINEIAESVQRGLEAPIEKSSGKPKKAPPQLSLLGQFLTPALTSICRKSGAAASLVGTATDVRDLIAYRLGFPRDNDAELPSLATGWRAELVGHLIEELLSGSKSIRIENAKTEYPLAFDDVEKE